jgi:hypothetical protein
MARAFETKRYRNTEQVSSYRLRLIYTSLSWTATVVGANLCIGRPSEVNCKGTRGVEVVRRACNGDYLRAVSLHSSLSRLLSW